MVAAIALAVAAAALLGRSSAAPPAALDILLIGDSITLGRGAPPGFRGELARLLAPLLPAPLARRISFVGSTGEAPWRGHFRGGARAADFYPPAFGSGSGNGSFDVGVDLSLARDPCVIAVHLGTNDLSAAPPYWPYSLDHGATLATSRSAELAELLAYVCARRPAEPPRIVLSLILPASGRGQDVIDWNEALIAMAEDHAEVPPAAAGGHPVRIALADHHARFSANPDLFTRSPADWMHDGLHPNRTGYAEMAAVYAAAIAAVVADTIPPAAAGDLAAAAIGMDRVALSLTAPGDDGPAGRAARYDLRVASSPITDGNFAHATQLRGEPAPAAAGAPDTLFAMGLGPGQSYFFALKTSDDGGNRSPLSNVVAVTTADRGRQIASLQNGVRGYAGTTDSAASAPRGGGNARGTLSIGVTERAGAPADIYRAFLRFDLSSIPAAARVHAARLRLFCYARGATEPVRIAAYRGADGGETIATAEMNAPGTWIEWDLTAAVAAWVGGTWDNEGLLLAAADETSSNRSWFWSAAYGDDAHLRPLLRIDYSLGEGAASGGPERRDAR